MPDNTGEPTMADRLDREQHALHDIATQLAVVREQVREIEAEFNRRAGRVSILKELAS